MGKEAHKNGEGFFLTKKSVVSLGGGLGDRQRGDFKRLDGP